MSGFPEETGLLEKWWLELVRGCCVAEASGLVQAGSFPLFSQRPLLLKDKKAFRCVNFTVGRMGSVMSRLIAMDQLKNILFALSPSRKGQGLLLLCKNSLPFSEIQRMPVLQ